MTRSSWLAVPVFCGLALLSGCGSLFGGRESAPVTYVLRPAFAAMAVPSAGTKSLQVQRVVVAPGYARDEILRTETDRRLGQYASSRWPDALPSVVERLAVDAARGSGAWSVVHDAAAPLPATELLRLTVRRFDAEYTEAGRAPTVRVVIDATVSRRLDRTLLSAFTVETSAQAADDRMSAIVAAFDEAAGVAMDRIARRAAATE
jgi:cholesterol transport system auxiliary component